MLYSCGLLRLVEVWRLRVDLMRLAWPTLRNEGWLMVLLAACITAIVISCFEEIVDHHLMSKLMVLWMWLYISEDILCFTILQSL